MNRATETSESISFRLPAQVTKQLAAEGEKYQMSRDDYARRLVLDAVGDTDREELRIELAQVREMLEQLTRVSERDGRMGASDKSSQSVRDEIEAVRKELRRLRGDVASISVALLVHAGKVTFEDAKEWVTGTLLK